MAFSGLYGLAQSCNCFHEQGKPVSNTGIAVAAVLDIVASVAMVLLIAFGPKMGIKMPPMGNYFLGAGAGLNMLMLLHRNIVPVHQNSSVPAE